MTTPTCPWCHPQPAPPVPERDPLPGWCPQCGGTHGYHYPTCAARPAAPARWVREGRG
ncbi:MAG: hypothetical protein AB1578_22805 [Thermodesulfobacteriota bacterium]